MSAFTDFTTLYHLVCSPIRGQTHAERLDSFYRPQAEAYDRFRERLLQRRQDLYDALPVPMNGVWVDMGGGTGGNLEHLEGRIQQLSRVLVVDLCPSLLEVARNRIRRRGWKNVEAVAGDATSFQLEGQLADVVTFSYSLTMIPEWFAAVENAWRMLRPGGVIGVVDFYVSQKYPPQGQKRHSWLSRTLWPTWFAADNVHLGPDRLAYLQWRFQQEKLLEFRSAVPCVPGAKVPCFVFIGRRQPLPTATPSA